MKSKKLYPKRLADRIDPGKPYQPSNGTEGDMFRAMWCDQCTKDVHAPNHGGCPILMASMTYRTDDENYPGEWTHDDDGQPMCTAFDSIEASP